MRIGPASAPRIELQPSSSAFPVSQSAAPPLANLFAGLDKLVSSLGALDGRIGSGKAIPLHDLMTAQLTAGRVQLRVELASRLAECASGTFRRLTQPG